MLSTLWLFIIATANLGLAAISVHHRRYGHAVFSFGVFLMLLALIVRE